MRGGKNSRSLLITHHSSLVTFFINLRGEDEVALAQAPDGVRVDFDVRVAPAETDVGVVAFPFGDPAHAVDEGERVGEVLKLVPLREVLLFDRFPAAELPQKRLDLLAPQSRHAAVAGHAVAARKTLHLQTLRPSSETRGAPALVLRRDRKSTRLHSSHANISYAV